LVKADDSNNYMQADDPFYVDGNYLNPHRLVVKSSFDCRLPEWRVTTEQEQRILQAKPHQRGFWDQFGGDKKERDFINEPTGVRGAEK
jgi:hypothetical protein